MTKYRVHFDRVGRNHNVADLVVEAENADRIAEEVFHEVGKHLRSKSYEVTLHLESGIGKGFVDYGRFGNFTITEE